ncbi:MAG: chalcone isomerase family protein [Gammaproteobacteria bacterium]|nr:chalcone isomerase family protein [Gammaproteobacteria bacterium]MBU2058138.1 chalcone isomerase family protein [Gammaproteobacteria bacterium]MBU2176045.1 chalcone isomerase family protein [Gammaproteobacteria bacterium]MBU2247232.1 chalcone isomerase family protein [Gammaproteobacteria bacterium]MBU2342672.1 chalcone isomerase family protein [Gammaproteobacteria bacterium]
MRKMLLMTAFFCSLSAQAIPGDIKLLGQGQFSYLFWDLYQAQLYTADGSWNGYQQSSPLVLKLTYQRKISKDDFIEATMDQWKHLQGKLSAQHKEWAGLLDRLWTDVKKGDQLSCVLLPDGTVQFYFNDKLLGDVTDPAFGPAFLDIWLSDKTSAPKLRKQLLQL